MREASPARATAVGAFERFVMSLRRSMPCERFSARWWVARYVDTTLGRKEREEERRKGTTPRLHPTKSERWTHGPNATPSCPTRAPRAHDMKRVPRGGALLASDKRSKAEQRHGPFADSPPPHRIFRGALRQTRVDLPRAHQRTSVAVCVSQLQS